jgi:hypothetical protein
MPDEDMHEAHLEGEAEDEVEGDGEVRVRMRVMMRVRLRKRRLNSKIHLRVNRIQMYFQEAHLISPY